MNKTQHHPWSPLTKFFIALLLSAGALFVLSKLNSVIPPLVLSLILAYVLSPVVNALQDMLRLPRMLIIVIVYLILLLLIAAVLTWTIPFLINQVRLINLDLNVILNQVITFFRGQIIIGGFVIDGQTITETIANTLQTAVEAVFGQTLDLLTGVVESVIWIVFIFIVSMYMINDSASILTWFEKIPPPGYREDFTRLLKEINTIWGAFFRGQLLLSLVVTCIVTAEGLILGLPFAFVMGILAGLLEFMPSIGHTIWGTIAAIIALFLGSTWIPLQNWAFAILVVGVHAIFTQVDLNYFIPRIIGRSVHLSPMVVILGIVAGAYLAGVLGVVLAAPSIASLRIIGRYIFNNLFDLEPFPQKEYISDLPPPTLKWWKKQPLDDKTLKQGK